MSDRGATGFSNQALLDQLLAGPYAHFTKVGEDDYRDCSERNPGLSLSSNGYYDHKAGKGGSLSELARDESRDVSHWGPHHDHYSSKPSGNKTEKATSDTAAYLWEKANIGEEARADIEEYLTGIRRIPTENYMDLIDTGLLRYLPADEKSTSDEKRPPALVHPFKFIEQDGSIRTAVRKIQLTRKEGNPRKPHFGSDGHLTILPPLDPTNPDNCFLATEGLENALTMRSFYPRKQFVVTNGKSNLKHLLRLAKPEIGVLIIADHDVHAKPHENGQLEAARVRRQLRDQGVNCVAMKPKQPNWDANAALQENKLEEWRNLLVEVPEYEKPEQPKLPKGFRFVPFGESAMQIPEMLVGRILECGTLAELYGDSNTGKSFVAMDLAFSVATGCQWHGEAVRQGGVLYFAGEGEGGLYRRKRAWEIARGQSLKEAPIDQSSGVTDLTDKQCREEVLDRIREKAEQVSLKLVVIDTLSRHFGGKDENQTSEMSQFVSALDNMRQEFGVTVLLVHHTGKDANKGPRGSNALRAALDNEILVTRKDHGPVVLTNTKMKDAEPFRPMAFQLVAVNLQDDQGRELADDYGQPFTSCVLEPAEVPRQSPRAQPKKGSNQENFDRVFAQQQQLGQSPVSLEAVRKALAMQPNRWRELLNSKYIMRTYDIANNCVEMKCFD